LQVDGKEHTVGLFHKGDMAWFHTLDRGPTCSSNIPSPFVNVVFPSRSGHGALWKALAKNFEKIVDDAVQVAHDAAVTHAEVAGEVVANLIREEAVAGGKSESEATHLGNSARREIGEQTMRAAVQRARAAATSVESKARHFSLAVAEQAEDGSAASLTEAGRPPELLVWNHRWRATQAAATEAYRLELEASGKSAAQVKLLVKKKAVEEKHGLIHGPSGAPIILVTICLLS
jgi:hypothetical protein